MSPISALQSHAVNSRQALTGFGTTLTAVIAGGLFDLRDDIGERRDLSEEKPEVLKEVQARFASWKMQMQAAEPRGPFRDF